LRYRILLLAALILLNAFNMMQVSEPTTSFDSTFDIPCRETGAVSTSECYNESDDMILFDDFVSAPIGFNDSLWNLHTINNPTLTWADGNAQVLNSEKFTQTTLESVINSGPEVIAVFNLSFTEGLSYFGIGWVDEFQDPVDNWISNLRVCQNGVFIDYWDDKLLLVSCSAGVSVSTVITDLDLTEEHLYRLSWSESLVRLFIDNVESGIVSRHVPLIELPFTITISGHHYLVETDQLTIDRVGIYERELCESEVYPKISLLWPANTTTLFDFEEVDIEIEGEDGEGVYSWDSNTNSSFFSPWDIPVPLLLGEHHLDVFAKDSDDNWSSLHMVFTVIDQETYLSVPESAYEPQIDGIVSRDESVSFSRFSSTLRGEDRSERPFELYIGFHNDSLYVGAVTTLQDRYHSRISLYIDGDGSGIWGDAELGSLEDICITSEAPSANQIYRGIKTPYDQEVHPLGVVHDSGVSVSGVTAEFLIPTHSVDGNSSIGLGLYLVVSQGGFDSYFPISETGNFLIVRSSGPRVTTSFDGLTIVVFLSVGSTLAAAAIVLKKKKPGTQIEITLKDEELERIRILLYSHPEILIDRLALLANTDIKSVRVSIDRLIRNDLIEQSVIITERDIVRILAPSEKKQK
jgi:hypothetical protein